MSIITFLQDAAQGGNNPSGMSGLLGTIVPFLLIIVIFYFFLIRPQNKKQKETQKMLNSLAKGDKVVTIGGIHGVVSSVKEKTIIVKVDDNCKMEFTRSAIAACETEKPVEEKPSKKDKKAEAKEEVKKEDAKAEEVKTE